MTDRQRRSKKFKNLDWTAVYADFQSKNCSFAIYYTDHFKNFCITWGLCDVFPGRSTFYRHFKKIHSQLGSLSENEASAPAQESACSATENEPTHEEEVHGTTSSDTDLSQVAVFDLEKLVATAAASAPASPHLFSGDQPSGLSQLNVEWAGMRFSYACLDPGRNLALLLYRLKELEEEARHAY